MLGSARIVGDILVKERIDEVAGLVSATVET